MEACLVYLASVQRHFVELINPNSIYSPVLFLMFVNSTVSGLLKIKCIC